MSIKKNDLRIIYIIKVVMIQIYEIVKYMNRTEKIVYFKPIAPEEKKSYDKFLTYPRV